MTKRISQQVAEAAAAAAEAEANGTATKSKPTPRVTTEQAPPAPPVLPPDDKVAAAPTPAPAPKFPNVPTAFHVLAHDQALYGLEILANPEDQVRFNDHFTEMYTDFAVASADADDAADALKAARDAYIAQWDEDHKADKENVQALQEVADEKYEALRQEAVDFAAELGIRKVPGVTVKKEWEQDTYEKKTIVDLFVSDPEKYKTLMKVDSTAVGRMAKAAAEELEAAKREDRDPDFTFPVTARRTFKAYVSRTDIPAFAAVGRARAAALEAKKTKGQS